MQTLLRKPARWIAIAVLRWVSLPPAPVAGGAAKVTAHLDACLPCKLPSLVHRTGLLLQPQAWDPDPLDYL